jgi:transcriptional regulator with XRE-family HTH domain
VLRLKYERLLRGWNQVALAFHAQMSIGDVSKIENGRLLPYPKQLAKLANVLGVDGAALLQEVSAEKTPTTEAEVAGR